MCYTVIMDMQFVQLQPTIPKVKLSVKNLYSVYNYYYSKNFVFTGEYHNCWELIYLQKGEVIITTPEYDVKLFAGQIFLHSPNEKHAIRANNVSCSVFFYSFDCACEDLYKIAHKPLMCSSYLADQLLFLFEEGRIALAGKNHVPRTPSPPSFANLQLTKTLLELVLILLIRTNILEPHKTEQKKIDYSFYTQKIIDYMNNNLQRQITLTEISQYIGFSIPHLCAHFKKETGMSVKAYFEYRRIERAKHFLAENDMSVQEVSDYFDFDSVQHFSLRFKKITGFTPSQFSKYMKTRNYLNLNFNETAPQL